jgi:hypothetical protein
MMKPIASKEEILNAIRNSLLRDLRQTMDDSPATDEDNEDARKTVNLFIEDRLSHLSGAALLERDPASGGPVHHPLTRTFLQVTKVKVSLRSAVLMEKLAECLDPPWGESLQTFVHFSHSKEINPSLPSGGRPFSRSV